MGKGKIYMLPTPIGDTPVWDVLPQYNRTVIDRLEYFIVENTRSARRFLSRAGIQRPIDSLRFAELNEHSTPEAVAELLTPVLAGTDAGVISEAGLPGVADPGADLAALAHLRGVEVVPLVGPSSILLALMASGLNGQSFAFNGYLPGQTTRTRPRDPAFRKTGANRAPVADLYRNALPQPETFRRFSEGMQREYAADGRGGYPAARSTHPHRANPRLEGENADIHKRPAIFILGV